MATRVGLRPATIAVAVIASLAAAPAASAAIKGAYEPPIVLPGDASAAAVTADPHNWLVSARSGATARAIARRFGARSIGSREIGAFVVARERARALAGALKAEGLLVSAYPNALRYRAQAPLIDELLKEIGLDTGKSGQNMASGLLNTPTKPTKVEGSGS
jgi:hypothetical protein